MESKSFHIPKQQNYHLANQLAYKIAKEKIARFANIKQQCKNSGAVYEIADSRQEITITFLMQKYIITIPDIEIFFSDSTKEVPLRDKLLISHYIITAKGNPLLKKLISFRELPAGMAYYPTFVKRTINPLLDHFGPKPYQLITVASKLGGQKVDYGDTAVTIYAFIRVPITIILWHGDIEFTPRCSLAFDASISDYLPTEDITVLCENIAWKLVKLLKCN